MSPLVSRRVKTHSQGVPSAVFKGGQTEKRFQREKCDTKKLHHLLNKGICPGLGKARAVLSGRSQPSVTTTDFPAASATVPLPSCSPWVRSRVIIQQESWGRSEFSPRDLRLLGCFGDCPSLLSNCPFSLHLSHTSSMLRGCRRCCLHPHVFQQLSATAATCQSGACAPGSPGLASAGPRGLRCASEDPRVKKSPGGRGPQKEGEFLAHNFSPSEGAPSQVVGGRVSEQDAGQASTVGHCLDSSRLPRSRLGCLSITS